MILRQKNLAEQRTLFMARTGHYQYIRKMYNEDSDTVAELIQRLRKPLLKFINLGKIFEQLIPSSVSLITGDKYLLVDSLGDYRNEKNFLRVYQKEKIIQGFSWGKLTDESWLIHNVVVDPSYEKKGIGSALFYDLLFCLEQKSPVLIGVYSTHLGMDKILERSKIFKLVKKSFSLYGPESYWYWLC